MSLNEVSTPQVCIEKVYTWKNPQNPNIFRELKSRKTSRNLAFTHQEVNIHSIVNSEFRRVGLDIFLVSPRLRLSVGTNLKRP